MTRSSRSLALLFVLSSLVCVAPVFAQADMYALTHPFALATATTTRLFGMGGFATCIKDVGFGNPAFAGTLTENSAVARQSVTTFDSGLKLTGEQASVAFPLKENKRGVQITGFRLTTDDRLLLPGAPPTSTGLSEYDIAFHYGHRLSSRFIVGFGISPVFHNSVGIDVAGGGPNLLQLQSSSERGCRLGALYELGNDSWIGAVYDRYEEDVVASGPMVGSSAVEFDFTSEEIAAGISHRLNPCVIAAVEWQQFTSKGGGTRHGDSGFRVGLEAAMDNNVTLRIGSNDGALSLGAGLTDKRWNFNYAFVKDWNKDVVEAMLGASETHQLEATYRF